MKNKFSNLNILLILFLCLVGFSPQRNIVLPQYSVYAETADAVDNSYTGTLTTDSFGTQIGPLLGTGEDTAKLDDITAGITMFISVIASLSNYMQGFAFALSACIIAWIGVKIMNSGKGNVIQFIKDKKDIYNALLCVLFIAGIPFLVKGVLEFKPPSYLMSPLDSGASGNVAISDLVTRPKSGLVTYITEHEDLYKNHNTKTGNLSETIDEKDDTDQGFLDMIIEKVCSAVLRVLTLVIYTPLLLVTALVGSLSFFPVSFDMAMYNVDGKVVELATSFFSGQESVLANLPVKNIISMTAEGLGSLTNITNLLFFIVKKFCMVSIEFVCYYYGIMHLLGKEPDDVGKFLGRLAKGVIGITLFPFIIEFLLDVDGMIASSILRITGTSFPGFGIMSVLPSTEDAKTGFTILVLSILMCSVVFSLAKSFFIRRIEIMFYYIASPAFFLKDMMASSGGGVKKLTDRLLSSVFLTTVYAPVLALVNLMITLALSNNETGFIYYAIVIAVLLLGKPVITDLIGSFAGSSSAVSSAQQQYNTALSKNAGLLQTAKTGKDLAVKGAKVTAAGAGIAAAGIGAAAYKTGRTFQAGKGMVKSIKNNGFWGATKNGFKQIGSTAGNKLRSQYWKNYNALDKKYGGKSLKDKDHNYQMEIEKNKGEFQERNDPKAKELELQKIQNKNKHRAGNIEKEKQREDAKAIINAKYPNDINKAERELAKYEEMIKTSGKHADSLDKFKDFKSRGDAIARKSNMPEAVSSMNEYGSTLNELPSLHEELDSAIKEGRVDDAFRINKDIDKRYKFLAATEASVTKMSSVTNAKSTRDASMNTLKAIHDSRGIIEPPQLEVTDLGLANNFLKSINNTPEIIQNEALQPLVAQMSQAVSNDDLIGFQSSVERFAVTQRSVISDSSVQGKVNRELSKVFNVSSDDIKQHAAVIQTGIDVTSGAQAQAYHQQVGSIASSTSNTTTIADYIAVSRGANATNYANAQSGVVNNVLKANTTNEIATAARTEAQLNNGRLDYNSLQTIITNNGGARTVQAEYNELKTISSKENEKFREVSANIPTRVEYGLPSSNHINPPTPRTTNVSQGNVASSSGRTSSNRNSNNGSTSNGSTNSRNSNNGSSNNRNSNNGNSNNGSTNSRNSSNVSSTSGSSNNRNSNNRSSNNGSSNSGSSGNTNTSNGSSTGNPNVLFPENVVPSGTGGSSNGGFPRGNNSKGGGFPTNGNPTPADGSPSPNPAQDGREDI